MLKIWEKSKLKIDIDIQILIGDPYVKILEIACSKNIDLIVIGTHRHINRKEPIIGNVIDRLVKSINKSLLVVNNRYEKEYSNIIAAIDFNQDSRESLKKAFKFFGDSKFTLLNTYSVPFLGFTGQDHTIEQKMVNKIKNQLTELVNGVLKEL